MSSGGKATDVALVRSPQFLRHRASDPHPENPQRLQSILEIFEEDRALAALPTVEPVAAERQDLERVHLPELVQRLGALRGETGWIDGDTYFDADSIETARLGVGACVRLALAIWKGEYRRGFSLVRPPGHHATPARAMGFCLFNNIALAAAAIRASSPQARLAIVDFDLHHGNGTQDAFYADPSVLFVSSHRYPFYPGTGALEEVGRAKGTGATVNFPLAQRYDDSLFLSLYGGLVSPILAAFRPDMILVSAGFDGHAVDPMHGFALQTPTFARLAELLVAAAERTTGKILFVLEGGYHPGALKESVRAVLAELVRLPRERFEPEVRAGSGFAVLDRFQHFLKPYFPEL